jgi:hypothetical protein
MVDAWVGRWLLQQQHISLRRARKGVKCHENNEKLGEMHDQQIFHHMVKGPNLDYKYG